MKIIDKIICRNKYLKFDQFDGRLEADGGTSTQTRGRKASRWNNSAALVSCRAEVLHPSQRPTPTWQNTIRERIAAEKTTKLDHPKTKTLINGSGETALSDWSDCQRAARSLHRWYARNNRTRPTNTTHHHVLSSYMLIAKTASNCCHYCHISTSPFLSNSIYICR